MRGFLTLKSAYGPGHAFSYWKSLDTSVVKKGSEALLQAFEDAWTNAAKGSKDSFASAKRAARAANVSPSQVCGAVCPYCMQLQAPASNAVVCSEKSSSMLQFGLCNCSSGRFSVEVAIVSCLPLRRLKSNGFHQLASNCAMPCCSQNELCFRVFQASALA